MSEPKEPTIVVVAAPEEGAPPRIDALREVAEVHVATDEASLREHLPRADVLLVTDFRTDLVERHWDRAENVRWVHATSAGVDRLVFPALRESDVPVTNAKGIFDRAIAETVLGFVLLYAKDLHGTLRRQRQRVWEHRDTERIDGREVLVVGAGSIGTEIGQLLRGVGMRTHGIARSARDGGDAFEAVHASDALHARLGTADFVVIAAPLTDETRGLIGDEELAAMKPSARLINIGRGPIVQTDALVSALERGAIAGAALDVFEEEPLPEDHPLWAHPEVVVSAHMAGDFLGWREALIDQFLDLFESFAKGEPLHHVVDKKRGYVPTDQETDT